jgi:hypothetical protein
MRDKQPYENEFIPQGALTRQVKQTGGFLIPQVSVTVQVNESKVIASLIRRAFLDITPFVPKEFAVGAILWIFLGLIFTAGFKAGFGAAAGAASTAVLHPNNSALILEMAGRGAYVAILDYGFQLVTYPLFTAICLGIGYAANGLYGSIRGALVGRSIGIVTTGVVSTLSIAAVTGATGDSLGWAAIAGLVVGGFLLLVFLKELYFDHRRRAQVQAGTRKAGEEEKKSTLEWLLRHGIMTAAGAAAGAILQSSPGAGAVIGVFCHVTPLVGLLPYISASQ